MKTKATFLTVMLFAIFAGQVFAGNPVKRIKSKPTTVQTMFFSKAHKAYAEKHKNKGAERHASYAAAIAQSNSLLRSYLEPGHSRPDSAISVDGYGYENEKIVFSYRGDTITETGYSKVNYDYETGSYIEEDTWITKNYWKEDYVFDANGRQTLSIRSYYRDNVLDEAWKEERAYNPNGTPLSYKEYDFDNGEWVLYYEQVFQYDANGMLTGGSITGYDEGVLVLYPMTVSGTVENLEITIVIGGMVMAK